MRKPRRESLNEAHLLEVSRYLVLNPVRAGIVNRPQQRSWSVLPATGHSAETSPRHSPEATYAGRPTLKALFGNTQRPERRKRIACIAQAYLEHGYTVKQNADHLGLHHSTESVILHTIEKQT